MWRKLFPVRKVTDSLTRATLGEPFFSLQFLTNVENRLPEKKNDGSAEG